MESLTCMLVLLMSFPFIFIRVNGSLCTKPPQSNTSGVILSPGFPGPYPETITCTYNITVSPSYRIEMTWKTFDVFGNMPRCQGGNEGYLAVYIGCTTQHLVSKFCSSNSGFPHTIYTLDHCLSLVLISTGKSGKGFEAFWKAVPSDKPTLKGVCKSEEEIFDRDQGVLLTNMWPVSIPSERKSCKWILKTSKDKVFQVNIIDFDAHAASRTYCIYPRNDRLDIKGLASKTSVAEKEWCISGTVKPFSVETGHYELDVRYTIPSTHYQNHRGINVGYITYSIQVTTEDSTFPSFWFAIIAAIVITFCGILSALTWIRHRNLKQKRISSLSQNNTKRGIAVTKAEQHISKIAAPIEIPQGQGIEQSGLSETNQNQMLTSPQPIILHQSIAASTTNTGVITTNTKVVNVSIITGPREQITVTPTFLDSSSHSADVHPVDLEDNELNIDEDVLITTKQGFERKMPPIDD